MAVPTMWGLVRIVCVARVVMGQSWGVATDEQCPCVFIPGTNNCFKYDSRFQATSINEAMTFFDDLSLQLEKKPAELEVDAKERECRTKQCRVCRRLLKRKLRRVGLFENMYGEDGFENFIEPYSEQNVACERYRFARHDHETRMVRASNVNNPNKFQGSEFVGRLSGTRYTLSCVNKGSPDETNPDLLTLCSQCWAWRRLPGNYFPQYVNELICQTDKECLSGYASCAEGSRTVTVFRNHSNKLTSVSISASSFCECQVKAGTALAGLVTGSSPNESLSQLLTSPTAPDNGRP